MSSSKLLDAPSAEDGLSARESSLVYRVVMLQGFGMLISWNAVLNCTSWFKVRGERARSR